MNSANHPPTPSFKKEGENSEQAPSSREEGVGGGGPELRWLRARAREMRNNPTEPEKRLWTALRKTQLAHLKFRRQAVKGGRIFDFYCPAAKLAVEVDGDTHDWKADVERDVEFRSLQGIRVLRFTNQDVMHNLDGVVAAILEAAGQNEPPPAPLL